MIFLHRVIENAFSDSFPVSAHTHTVSHIVYSSPSGSRGVQDLISISPEHRWSHWDFCVCFGVPILNHLAFVSVSFSSFKWHNLSTSCVKALFCDCSGKVQLAYQKGLGTLRTRGSVASCQTLTEFHQCNTYQAFWWLLWYNSVFMYSFQWIQLHIPNLHQISVLCSHSHCFLIYILISIMACKLLSHWFIAVNCVNNTQCKM